MLSLFLLLTFLFLVLLVPFTVEFELSVSSDAVQPGLKLGIGPLRVAVPKALLHRAREMVRQRGYANLAQLRKGSGVAAWLLDRFVQRIEVLELQARIGTGDPFWSALCCGGAWAILGPVFAAPGVAVRMRKEPRISIHPDFERTFLELYLHCIFSFRLGQIMIEELKRATFAWQARA